MNIFRPGNPLPHEDSISLFLAGPTSRTDPATRWRVEALELLERESFSGDVLIPEPFLQGEYLAQVSWEKSALDTASLILFWVPRDLATLPGFTTNVEFGRYIDSGRIVYGRPTKAPKTRYLDWLYEEATEEAPCDTLDALIESAIRRLSSSKVQS